MLAYFSFLFVVFTLIFYNHNVNTIMFLKEEIVKADFIRVSKLGLEHQYSRNSRMCIFRCDNCGCIFQRKREKINPKRLSNNYFHCCNQCDVKRFAQKKGADRRTIWDRPASSMDDISKL
jgi:hypothetical protein